MMSQTMGHGLVLALTVAVATAASIGRNTDTCNSTMQEGMQRPWCNRLPGVNNVNTSQECAQLCCDHKASNPYAGDECIGWSLNGWGQCFMCSALDGNTTVQPAPAKCSSKTNCSTGIVTPPPAPPLPPAPQTGKLGGEGSVEYTDYGRGMRWPSYLNGTQMARTDLTPEGWPMTDCTIVIFDARPVGAWAPPMDDPEQRQADMSGDWTLRFNGQADVALADPSIKGITIGAPSYDPNTNTQSNVITIAKGKYPEVVNLLVLSFNNTRVSATAETGSGLTNISVIKPGYADKDQLFSDDWAALLAPFDHIRWMGTTGTNSYSWQCGGDNAAGCSVIEWSDRHMPFYAFTDKAFCKGCLGLSWEHVLLAANELHKDIWINVPVTASAPTVCRTADTTKGGDPHKCLDTDPTQTYEYQLAEFFKNGNEFTNYTGLHPDLNIYIEHSNEVWNFGFPQYGINKAFAMWEVQNSTTKSNLANPVPGRPDINCTYNAECWTHRRHARRVYEISQTFEKVFGPGSLNKRIRMVYASWTISEQEYYNNTLAWLANEYGPVKNYLYAISAAQYFGPHAQDASGKMGQFNYSTATIPEVIAAFKAGADVNVEMVYNFVQFAKFHGVTTAGYESGPGYAVGGEKPGSKGLNTMIEASRDPGMKDAIEYDVRETCWRHGWDIYNYFAIEGAVSRYGCWGATESWADRNPGPPKLQAIYELTGTKPSELEAWAFDPARPRARVTMATASSSTPPQPLAPPAVDVADNGPYAEDIALTI